MSGRDAKRGPVNSALSRGYGTLAGLGIIGAAVIALPSTLFLDPRPEAAAYLTTVAALVIGLVCMGLPWERIDARWLHLVGVIATVQAAVAVAVFGQAYVAFYFLIALAAAYMTWTWKELLVQLGLIGVALFGPVLWGPQEPAETLQVGLVVFPLLCLTTGIFGYLRHRMVADQSSYRVFAEETLSLATRIAGRPLASGQSFEVESDLPLWSQRQHISTRVAAASACVLAVPLLTAGLAAAGVKLPAIATETLGDVGIELPNQGSSHGEETGSGDPSGARWAGATPAGGSGGDSSHREQPVGGAGDPSGRGGGGARQTDESVSGKAEGPSSSSVAMSPDSNAGASPPVGGEPGAGSGSGGDAGSGDGSAGGSGDLGDALGETIGDLDGLTGNGDNSAE